jgi:murein DD-endopeptidase MepM/ murein hydrolase activator NlpD
MNIIDKIKDIIYRIFFSSDKRQNWHNLYEEPEGCLYDEEFRAQQVANHIKKVKYQYPVKTKRVTSPYGWRKLPGMKRHFHTGTDFTGKNKFCEAPCDCVVIKILKPDKKHPYRWAYKKTGWEKIDVPRGRAWTPYVILEAVHDMNLRFVYRHVDPTVTPGHRIARGDKVGIVGNFGWSQGAHLHFEVQRKTLKKWVKKDPMKFLRANA